MTGWDVTSEPATVDPATTKERTPGIDSSFSS